ncbi:MAG: hypothetical protein ABJ308_06990 [Halieaceae bacterium]
MDRNEAIAATKNGAIAATISGVLTLLVTAFAIYSSADGDLAFFNDSTSFIDVAFLLVCALGVYRKSRAAAIVVFVYFIISKIIMGVSMGRVPGLAVSLIFLYFFGKAIQGSFVYHRLEKAENPNYKAPSRWYAFIGIPVGIILIALLSLGMLSMTGAVPSTQVLAGDKIPQNQLETLLTEGIIDEGEEIEYFYSAGMTSIMEDGNLLTNRRVISYFINQESELEIYELLLPQIRNIELVQEGSFLNDTIYQVNAYQEDAWLQINLSTEDQGDVRFFEALQKMIDNPR